VEAIKNYTKRTLSKQDAQLCMNFLLSSQGGPASALAHYLELLNWEHQKKWDDNNKSDDKGPNRNPTLASSCSSKHHLPGLILSSKRLSSYNPTISETNSSRKSSLAVLTPWYSP
jgi:hypothetical protein